MILVRPGIEFSNYKTEYVYTAMWLDFRNGDVANVVTLLTAAAWTS